MRTALALAGLTAGLLTALPATVPAVAAPAVRATCDGLRATVVGTAGDDVLRGTPGRDVVAGLDGDDRLLGLGGDDVLCGGAGADVLEGGAGNDRLLGGLDALVQLPDTDFPTWVGDRVAGGPGDDRLDAGRDPRTGAGDRTVRGGPDTYDVVDFSGATRGVRVDLRRGTARGEGRDTVVHQPLAVLTTRHDDVVRGGTQPLRVVTGRGDDTVRGSSRDDEIEPDGRTTTQSAGLRRDPDIGRGGTDTVDAGRGDDAVRGGRGRDVVRGGGGRDDLSWSGAGGPAVLDGGPGRDQLQVVRLDLSEPSTITVGSSPERREELYLGLARTGAISWDLTSGVLLVDGQDRGTRVLGAAEIHVTGSPTSLTVTGTSGADDLETNTATVFRAGAGDDRFRGSASVDTFDGGDGTDTYDRDSSVAPRTNACASVEDDRASACLPAS